MHFKRLLKITFASQCFEYLKFYKNMKERDDHTINLYGVLKFLNNVYFISNKKSDNFQIAKLFSNF